MGLWQLDLSVNDIMKKTGKKGSSNATQRVRSILRNGPKESNTRCHVTWGKDIILVGDCDIPAVKMHLDLNPMG